MCFSILIFFSLTLFLSFCHTTRGDERRYECGAHGRFEYCIDGFPGCVVGCHCHPGYYFDTDSKICEPNVKLQQEFRRHYIAEPPHMQTPANTPIALDPTPTPTPKTNTQLDEKVDEITKDADDIGDWLYNQFFKTIENQVINKTSDKPSKLTRRSGSGPPQRKNKRKSRKSSKDSKKKMGKVHGLRRKLLRITEDDSLFDSSSSAETTSDETTSTSSESDSSDTTSESEGKKDDKEHGHSTILLFNKKPKPPLPSFIFLPHMGTPFYPPIGLPPPPVLPMYPMVPIPPMAPMFPYPASNKEEDNTNNGANAASSTLTPNEPPSNTDNTTAPGGAEAADGGGGSQGTDTGQPPSSANTTESFEDPPQPGKKSPNGLKFHIRHEKKSRKGLSHPKEPNIKNMFRTKFNKGPRKKLMQKLRDNMQSKIPLINQFDNDQEEDSPLMNDLSSQEAYSLSQKIHLRAMEDGVPKMKDVDFKYLSELIHRANLNDTQKLSPHPIEPSENRRDMTYAGQVGRRSYQNEPAQKYTQQTNNFKEPRNLQTSGADNAFYSNLGRQIATMIRNIDSMGDRQVNIEIERTNPTITQPMFNENRYAPRSYWERSVRSPLHYFKEELEYLNTSNEKLFSLEKEVENAATTSPSLSLHDLEDILSTMSKAQVQIQRKVLFEEHKPDINKNNTRLNINLLPKHEISNNEKFYEAPNHNEYRVNTTKPKANDVNITLSSNTINRSKYSQLRVPADFWWLDMVKPIPVRQPEINKSINLNPIYDIKPTRRTLTDEISTTVETIQSVPRRQHVDELKFIKALSRRQLQQTTTILPNLKYQTRILDYFNYFPSTRNDHKHDQRPIPYRRQISSFSRSINTPIQKPMRRPSYFHHELQHFDFFE